MAIYDDLISMALKSKGTFDLSEEELVAFVKAGAVRAYKAVDSARENEDIEADFNPETRNLRLKKKVAGQEQAVEINDETTLKTVETAISAMKREIEDSWKNANSDLIHNKFQELKGQCLPAQVLQGDSLGSIPVAINQLDAVLPAHLQIPNETLSTGSTILVYVKELTEKGSASEIVVSRIEPELLIHSMKLHIPEVDTGHIEIKAMSRLPGKSSKIAVFSNDLNAVERCEKRIEKVKEDLGSEEIRFIEWYDDPKAFIVSSLEIEAREVMLIEGEKQALVEVFKDSAESTPDLQGQRRKQAEELTGYKIDIKLVSRGKESELPGV